MGQQRIIAQIRAQVKDETFPRFSIFVGPPGSEKKSLAKLVADELHAHFVCAPDCKVETMRTIIEDAYRVATCTVYLISDADSMSVQARNSLLKVTEEPPHRAYFIMTLESLSNTLPTICSRASTSVLDPYTPDELIATAHSMGITCDEFISDMCDTPGDVATVLDYNPSEFYAFVERVVDHVARASGSNAFKIAKSIQFKDSDESGYDLRLFWKAFCVVCFKKQKYDGIAVTSKYVSKLRNKSINRAMLFDAWLLDIRQLWRDTNGSC